MLDVLGLILEIIFSFWIVVGVIYLIVVVVVMILGGEI